MPYLKQNFLQVSVENEPTVLKHYRIYSRISRSTYKSTPS